MNSVKILSTITIFLCIVCITVLYIRATTMKNIMTFAEHKETKYITYLSHSGLHNQRIGLINAMVIAKVLNRTLIMPEINIGSPTNWQAYDMMTQQLEICPTLRKIDSPKLYNELDCYKYSYYIPMAASDLFQTKSANEIGIKTINLRDVYDISKQDIYTFKDTTRYDYQLYDDNLVIAEDEDKYARQIQLETLSSIDQQLLQFGSLFGLTRLILNDSKLVETRKYLHSEIGFQHTDISNVVVGVTQLLGDYYMSIHIRQGDGIFKSIIDETISEISMSLDSNNFTTTIKNAKTLIDRLNACQHDHQIIYLATDAQEPQQQFSRLYEKYMCLFTLQDLLSIDNIGPKSSLFLSMIDAEVAAFANVFIAGTPGSTFSEYIRNRNQHYHHL